jgi:hypothetical protein
MIMVMMMGHEYTCGGLSQGLLTRGVRMKAKDNEG